MNFAEVLLPFGNIVSNRPYTYSIPERLQGKISVGDAVWVPFRSATASGIVVGVLADTNRPTKSIHDKNTQMSSVSGQVLHFSRWLSDRYVSSWWEALRGFLVPVDGKTSLTETSRSFSGLLRGLQLTQEQEQVASQVKQAIGKHGSEKFLLHGVTGSGKTEVYLSCAEEAVLRGKEVLVLVPEIPLSFQLAERFRDYFGDAVAVLHSGLSEKEKRREQGRLQSGQAVIGVGPRMALFAPFKNLGLIVMDEEHDPSYKQENSPRYHAFTLAEKLAEAHQATFLFGTATPSLERYCDAKEGRIGHLVLDTRFESSPLPEIEVVDLREEEMRETRPFSPVLLQAVRDSIAMGRQSILFINRRGFSPMVFCRDCGHALYCPHCSITLTYHQKRKVLRCHYCDYQNYVPEKCPHCDGSRLTHRGFGTERLEERIREFIPEAKVARLDSDTTSRRGAARGILDSFSRGDTNVLIGTQMVTKGFDFPNVHLVGIIFADHLLHFPDFRSAERTFQLLTQVSGRAGRRSVPGRVILQTYDPDHPVIHAVARHDYARFYSQEIENRKKALYPPFVSLANFLVTGQDETEVESRALALREFLLGALTQDEASFLLGPSPCPIQKISKNFRWHLLLKSKNIDHLTAVSKEVYTWYAENGSRKVRLTIDIDPVRLL